MKNFFQHVMGKFLIVAIATTTSMSYRYLETYSITHSYYHQAVNAGNKALSWLRVIVRQSRSHCFPGRLTFIDLIAPVRRLFTRSTNK